MPDVGQVDDFVIAWVLAAEDWKQSLELEDNFGQTREWLHGILGINE
ncbi:MAG: hypothetical protein AAF393_17725 [Pseudomonadota bacterium]